jgi:hypothetical protein
LPPAVSFAVHATFLCMRPPRRSGPCSVRSQALCWRRGLHGVSCAALTCLTMARACVLAQVAKAMYGDMFDNTAPRKTKEAHCSWCYEFSTHFFIKDKDHWLCDACKGKTTESQRCSDAMARLEGSNKRSAVCAKSLPTWEEALERKKKAFSKQWNATKIRYELTRESPTRHQVAPHQKPASHL